AYAAQVASDGGTYLWELNETSGTTAADSIDSNPGTYRGGFTLNQTTPLLEPVGSPAIAWTEPIAQAAQEQNFQGNISLSVGNMSAATPTSGSGSGSGGGSSGGALCFSPETLLKTQRGDIRFDEIEVGDQVVTARGTSRKITKVHIHDYEGPMFELPHGGLITPSHEVLRERWLPAHEVLSKWQPFHGKVYNATVEADPRDSGNERDTEHSYTLASGIVAHNIPFHK